MCCEGVPFPKICIAIRNNNSSCRRQQRKHLDRAVLAVQELQGIVSRAALQSPEAAQQLPEEVFWFARPPKDLLKWNLLSPGAFPWLKPFLRRQAQPLHVSACTC